MGPMLKDLWRRSVFCSLIYGYIRACASDLLLWTGYATNANCVGEDVFSVLLALTTGIRDLDRRRGSRRKY